MNLTTISSERELKRYHKETLKNRISDVLTSMETNIELSGSLLFSYPSHLRTVKNANGSHTGY